MNLSTDYRTRIYEKYVSSFKGTEQKFNLVAADRWGKAYDHYFRDWLPSDKSAAIVDLACGDGKLLHFFCRRGYTNVFGVDISEEQIALARQVTPNAHLGNIFDFLKAHPSSFDLITAVDIIEHLKKDEFLDFLDNCFASLKPGGRLILQTPNAQSPMFGTVYFGDFTHEVGVTPNCLASLLRLTGFGTIEERETGPISRGVRSWARMAIWRTIRIGLNLWNLAETGTAGSKVFTRVFIMSACKP